MPVTTSGPFNSSTSVTTTEAPSSASNSAIARPMPDAPPVTNATLPATCPAMSALVPVLALPDHVRSLIWHGDIEHAQLHAFGALPAIDRDRSRDMQDLSAMCGQRIAKLLADCAKRNPVDNRTIARLEAQ